MSSERGNGSFKRSSQHLLRVNILSSKKQKVDRNSVSENIQVHVPTSEENYGARSSEKSIKKYKSRRSRRSTQPSDGNGLRVRETRRLSKRSDALISSTDGATTSGKDEGSSTGLVRQLSSAKPSIEPRAAHRRMARNRKEVNPSRKDTSTSGGGPSRSQRVSVESRPTPPNKPLLLKLSEAVLAHNKKVTPLSDEDMRVLMLPTQPRDRSFRRPVPARFSVDSKSKPSTRKAERSYQRNTNSIRLGSKGESPTLDRSRRAGPFSAPADEDKIWSTRSLVSKLDKIQVCPECGSDQLLSSKYDPETCCLSCWNTW